MTPLEPADILAIEDDVDAQANLRDILELDNHRVIPALSAAEALDRDDWGRYAAILLDRRLPDASAEELLPQLRQLAPEAAIIVVTGYHDLRGAIDALRAGANDYILKPLDAEDLRRSLGRALELRSLRQAKARDEANFRRLVESAECLIVIGRPDRTIAYFSPFAEQLTGYPAEEMFGRDLCELLSFGEDRTRLDEGIRQILSGGSLRGLEGSIRCRNGTSRRVLWNAQHLDDYDGAPAILGVGHDITGLKQAQERALQAERLAAIGQMVTGLAHESRNALQRSQACLEMLALRVSDQPEAIDLIRRIQGAQDHLHHLYEDVRSYAAPIRLELGCYDLPPIWREAWSYLEAARRGRDASLQEDCEANPGTFRVDPFRLVQVFRNILDNALAAGPDPVEIRIRCEPTRLEGRPAVLVSVLDNGPGLDPEQRQGLFEPFFTTKTKGTGLGMAIARRIVEAHGGRIAVGDRSGPGTEIVLTLPREPT
ncbi:ATP-binding protein [soil metagenome]